MLSFLFLIMNITKKIEKLIKKVYNIIMDLKTKIKELPTNSGVYIMKNINGEVIYVGKAKNLKNRVTQYFQNSKNHTIKVTSMVKNIADFHYIITPNEAEAFALENNLIKRYQPYYNILLKDGKSYPYIRIDVKQDFPRLEIVRKLKRDGAKYFGPYFAGANPTDLIKMIQNAYPLRMCSGSKLPKRTRPCINYDMGLCSAPCMAKIDKQGYKDLLKKAMDFLNGKYAEVQEILAQKMTTLAENEQFELAMSIRDSLAMLDRMKQKTLTFMPNLDNIDAFAWASNGSVASVAVLVVRGGRSVGVDCFHLIDSEIGMEDSLAQFITQYYSTTALPPEQVLIPFEPEPAFCEWLTEQRKQGAVGRTSAVELTYPQRGEKRQLLNIAKQNAEMYLDKAIEKEKRLQDYTTGAVAKLGEILNINPPRRMECYDISNIGGLLSVASMVVFIDGEAKTSHYRKFHIKTVEGANDFASMQEVISRRFNELKKEDSSDPSFSSKPDLIVIDGGKGQLSNARIAMNNCGYDVPMVGLAKQDEEIFVPNQSQPIMLPRTHNSLKLLQRIRDESHRFAITFHRSLRNKVTSVLEEVPGIGPKKRKNLIKSFKSLENMKKATIEELQEVDGISQKDAYALYNFLKEI